MDRAFEHVMQTTKGGRTSEATWRRGGSSMGLGRVRAEGEWVFVWWQAPLIVVILGPAFPGTYF